jgi:2-(1,2-epoxy-1,2-dihydrophenyl)acetyl-CoA isomerase
MNTTVLLERAGPVAVLTLNRPDALNTLDFTMISALIERSREVASDEAIRCVVLKGAGKHFMAGGDLKAFATQLGVPSAQRTAQFTQRIDELHAAIETLQRMQKPLVASVQGAVAGFGLSLMLACDLVVAAETSYFTSAYRHIALTPDGGCTYFLPRLVGIKKAMEIVLLGERFDAREALRLGLVNRVVADAELNAATQAIVDTLVRGPQLALRNAKRLVNDSMSHTLSEQLHAEALSFGACAGTEDFAQGINAFLEKRAAKFE